MKTVAKARNARAARAEDHLIVVSIAQKMEIAKATGVDLRYHSSALEHVKQRSAIMKNALWNSSIPETTAAVQVENA